MPRPHNSSGKAAPAKPEELLPKPGRTLTIIGQDPTLKVKSRILTATVTIPNEDLSAAGLVLQLPCGDDEEAAG